MNESGLVSAVITNYNYARYLESAVRSVQAQTWPSLEIVIVDDGSTDNSREIIERLSHEDHRIRPHFQPNSGQAAATNLGILSARGAHIAFLDADDEWLPEKLACQMVLFADVDMGVVYSSAYTMDPDGNVYGRRDAPTLDADSDALHRIIRANFIPFSSAVVSRACLSRSGLLDPRLRVCTDYDLWLRAAKTHRFRGLPEPLIRYRTSSNSLSSDPTEMLRVAREITDRFYDDNPGVFDARSIRHERIEAYRQRVYLFAHRRDAGQAFASFWRLLTLFPPAGYLARALFQLARMVVVEVKR